MMAKSRASDSTPVGMLPSGRRSTKNTRAGQQNIGWAALSSGLTLQQARGLKLRLQARPAAVVVYEVAHLVVHGGGVPARHAGQRVAALRIRDEATKPARTRPLSHVDAQAQLHSNGEVNPCQGVVKRGGRYELPQSRSPNSGRRLQAATIPGRVGSLPAANRRPAERLADGLLGEVLAWHRLQRSGKTRPLKTMVATLDRGGNGSTSIPGPEVGRPSRLATRQGGNQR